MFKPPPPGSKTNCAMLSSRWPQSLSLSEEETSVSQALKWKNQCHCKNLMRRALHCSALSVWHNTSWHLVISSRSLFFIHCLYSRCLHWRIAVDIQAWNQPWPTLSSVLGYKNIMLPPQNWVLHTYYQYYTLHQLSMHQVHCTQWEIWIFTYYWVGIVM